MIPLAVRRESIILELEDHASREALQAAAALKTLDRSINSLSGTAVRARTFQSIGRDVDKMGASFDRAGSSIDSFSGRLGLLAQAALVLGPALAPIGASLVPGIAAMATGMTGAAAAAISAGLAFAGVGDVLGALNDVHLEPTAENLAKLQQAMDELGPAGVNFARFLHSLGGELEALQRTAGENMFPGMQEGLESLVQLMPRADRLIEEFASRVGRLSADAGASLAGPEWASFFTFLRTDAAPVFEEFARATGNVALGLGNLMVAFAPLSRDFAAGMLEASRSFAAWSADSGNFTDFIDYVRRVGPQVSDFLGSLGEAAVALTQAVAPWGSVVLPAMTTLLDLFTAVAGSPIGPALTTAALAMLAFNKAASASTAIMGRVAPAVGGMRTSLSQMRADLGTVATTWATAGAASERESKRMAAATGRIKANLADVGKGAGLLGAVGVAATGAAQGIGLQNTAMLGLAGTIAGPWGAAAGAGVGLILDYKAAQDAASASASSFAATLDQQTGALTANSRAWIVNQFDADQLNQFSEMGLDVGELTSALAGGTEGWQAYFASLTAGQRDALRGGNWGFGPQLVNDINDVANAVDGSSTVFDANKDAMEGMGGAASGAAKSLAELEAAQRAQNQATLASIDAGTRWGQAIADARKQAEAGTKGFNHMTKAGRANRTVMSQLVGAYNAQSDAAKNSARGYQAAREEIARVGKQMGLTRERIQQLQNSLDKPAKVKVDGKQALQTADSIRERIGRIPKNTPVRVTLSTSGTSNLERAKALMDSMHDKSVTFTTIYHQVNTQSKVERQLGRNGMADGGTILGQRHPYGDKVLIWGAPGEEIITNRNGEADRFRADRAAGRIPAYADGGTIRGYATGGKIRAEGFGKTTHTAEGWLSISKSMDHWAKMWDRAAKTTERALKDHEKQLERATDRLDYWNQKRDQLKQQVTGSLTRDWMGDGNEDIWSGAMRSGTVAYAQQQWKKQATDSKKLSALIANLRKNGAGDAFIAEILNSGDPLAAAEMFNKQSVAGMRHSQSLYLSATRATASAANSTSSIYADEQRSASRQIQHIRGDIHSLQALLKKQHKEAEASKKKYSGAKAAAKGARSQKR